MTFSGTHTEPWSVFATIVERAPIGSHWLPLAPSLLRESHSQSPAFIRRAQSMRPLHAATKWRLGGQLRSLPTPRASRPAAHHSAVRFVRCALHEILTLPLKSSIVGAAIPAALVAEQAALLQMDGLCINGDPRLCGTLLPSLQHAEWCVDGERLRWQS